MKQIRKRLTYANVMSSIAVFLVLGGAAIAATQLPKNSVGTKQLKKNAVVTAKIKNNAVTTGKIKGQAVASGKIKNGAVVTDKLADGAVSTGKLAEESVTTGKLAPSAVTAGKLDEAERSQAFQTWNEGLLNTEISTGLLGNYGTATVAVERNLNPGLYVVTASTEFTNSAIEERSAICRLFDDGTEIGESSAAIGQLIIVTQGAATITGISDGGELKLRCRSSGDKIFVYNRKITAIRTGSVN